MSKNENVDDIEIAAEVESPVGKTGLFFKYHNNDVFFKNKSKYRFEGGSYKVTSYNVTSGQDPNNEMGAILNVTRTFDSSGGLTFRLGRKGSGNVADWFNNKIGINCADNTTFGHTAGDLNFAFLGDLTLKFSGLPNTTGTKEIVFISKITMAQGHSGSANNWWFGGVKCFYTNDHRVHAIGKAGGAYYSVMIRRGGNQSEDYDIESVEEITPDWMSKLSNDAFIGHMSIPGTHDSGTQRAMSGTCRCQNFSIEAQLYHGIRFFDIRLKYNQNSLGVFHDKDYCDITFRQVMDWFSDFLHRFPQETVLMCVKSEGGPDFNQLFINIIKEYGSQVLEAKTIPNLGDARGKIVVFSRLENYTGNGIPLRDGWPDNSNGKVTISGSKPYQYLYVEDKYMIFTPFNNMEKPDRVMANIKLAIKNSDISNSYLTFNSLGFNPDSPYQHSLLLNKTLLDGLKELQGTGSFGMILLDFYNNHGDFGENKLVEMIIANNKNMVC